MTRLLTLSTCLFLLISNPAAAQERNCNEPQDQASMNHCAHQAWEAADGDLNLAYRLAMEMAESIDEFTPDGEEKSSTMLRDAQRAWIPFRDKACEVQSHLARGGSLQPTIYWSCMEQLTRQRTEQLRVFGERN